MLSEFNKMVEFEVGNDFYNYWVEPRYYDFDGNKEQFVEQIKASGVLDVLKQTYGEGYSWHYRGERMSNLWSCQTNPDWVKPYPNWKK